MNKGTIVISCKTAVPSVSENSSEKQTANNGGVVISPLYDFLGSLLEFPSNDALLLAQDEIA